jgi:hypothetical protein
MATTTPNFGWAVPTSSDLVKNGAVAIETLGDSIDASLVDLKGGTTGQVLAKATNTDMDFTWATPSGGSSNVAGKNAVLNSNFSIWQRGTAGVAGTSTGAYFADRWVIGRGVAGSTGSRQVTGDTTNLPNIQYCARVQRDLANASTNGIFLAQSFETINSIPLAGKTVTVSYYARAGANYSSASNALTLTAVSGTGTDQQVLGTYTGSSGFITSASTLTTTWQRFTATGTVPSTANEVAFYFNYTPVGIAGANDYFEVTGVQLEIAASASAYSPNASTQALELAACQRYYWRWNAATQFATVATGAAVSSTVACVTAYHPVPMRTIVSAIDGTANSTFRLQDQASGFTQTSVSIEVTQQDLLKTELNVNVASGLTQFRFMRYGANNSTSTYLGFSAEL